MGTSVTDKEADTSTAKDDSQALARMFQTSGRLKGGTALTTDVVKGQPGALEMPGKSCFDCDDHDAHEEVVSKYRFINWVRDKSPAVVVNNGARLNFLMRLPADVLTVKSGLRPGMISTFESLPRAAAGSLSGAALALGIIFNEEKQTPEEKKHLESLSTFDLIRTRVKHAFDPVHHPSATVGLATIPNGLLYMMSGKKLKKKGEINWEIVKGGLTVLGGAALNFIPDQEKAWQVSTGVFLLRAPSSFLNAWGGYFNGITREGVETYAAKSALEARKVAGQPLTTEFLKDYYKSAPGDWALLTKFGLNQGSNVFGLFYGGVEKTADGRIVKVKDEDEYHEQTPDVGTLIPDELTEDKAASHKAHEEYEEQRHEGRLPGRPVTAVYAKPAQMERVQEERVDRSHMAS